MKVIKYFFIASLLILHFTSSAQDMIHLVDQTMMETKVIEISDQQVKYKAYDGQNGPTFVVPAHRIEKVVLQDGTEHTFESPEESAFDFAQLPKRALKFSFLSPVVNGFTSVTYEQMLSAKTSFEARIAFIGLGRSMNGPEAAGIGTTVGYKFYLGSRTTSNDAYLRSLFHGSYLRFDATLGTYKYRETERFRTDEQVVFGGLTASLGKQWVFGERVLLDLYGGVGYGSSNDDRGTNFILHTTPAGLAFSGGLKIGFLF
ncbi:MAG: hypothetical protein AAF798_00015 [Bacteroidota bacterium]